MPCVNLNLKLLLQGAHQVKTQQQPGLCTGPGWISPDHLLHGSCLLYLAFQRGPGEAPFFLAVKLSRDLTLVKAASLQEQMKHRDGNFNWAFY